MITLKFKCSKLHQGNTKESAMVWLQLRAMIQRSFLFNGRACRLEGGGQKTLGKHTSTQDTQINMESLCMQCKVCMAEGR